MFFFFVIKKKRNDWKMIKRSQGSELRVVGDLGSTLARKETSVFVPVSFSKRKFVHFRPDLPPNISISSLLKEETRHGRRSGKGTAKSRIGKVEKPFRRKTLLSPKKTRHEFVSSFSLLFLPLFTPTFSLD